MKKKYVEVKASIKEKTEEFVEETYEQSPDIYL